MHIYEFSMSNNYMSLLRTTTCDALIVPSGQSFLAAQTFDLEHR